MTHLAKNVGLQLTASKGPHEWAHRYILQLRQSQLSEAPTESWPGTSRETLRQNQPSSSPSQILEPQKLGDNEYFYFKQLYFGVIYYSETVNWFFSIILRIKTNWWRKCIFSLRWLVHFSKERRVGLSIINPYPWRLPKWNIWLIWGLQTPSSIMFRSVKREYVPSHIILDW